MIALLELVSNDYIKRCFDMGISQIGTYTKCVGHSCLYDKARAPSYAYCQLQRVEIILNNYDNGAVEPCELCSDWWAKVVNRSKYSIPQGGDLTKLGMVEFSFELLINSLKDFRLGK